MRLGAFLYPTQWGRGGSPEGRDGVGHECAKSYVAALPARKGIVAFRRCHAPLSQSGHFKERSSPREEKSGSGVRDRASQSIYVARSPAPRRCSCPNSEGATAFAPRSLHSGPDLWDDNVPARHRQRTDPAPSPATLARFATRVPVQEMGQVSPRPERRECSCEKFLRKRCGCVAAARGTENDSRGLAGRSTEGKNRQLRKTS